MCNFSCFLCYYCISSNHVMAEKCISSCFVANKAHVIMVLKSLIGLYIKFYLFHFLGRLENLQDAFEDTTTKPGAFALAFYSGLFSYAGWYVS